MDYERPIKKNQGKKSFFNKFIRTKDPDDLRIFKSFRNRLTKEVRSARASYFEAHFLTCQNDSRKTWQKLNVFMNREPSPTPEMHIVVNGVEICDDMLPSCFNDHFTSNGRYSASANAYHYINAHCTESIFFYPTNEFELTRLFRELSDSSACDADGLQIRPGKYVLDHIAPVLVHLYNISLSSGQFPKRMQVEKVLALFKKGDRTKLSNYRPIFILPIFSKGLKKIIFCRLSRFLHKHNVITPHQHAFRKVYRLN